MLQFPFQLIHPSRSNSPIRCQQDFCDMPGIFKMFGEQFAHGRVDVITDEFGNGTDIREIRVVFVTVLITRRIVPDNLFAECDPIARQIGMAPLHGQRA